MGNAGSGFAVGEAVILEAAKDITQVKEDLVGDITQMRSRLQILESEWRGQGGAAFQGAINAWERTATRVMSAMDDFAASLTQSDTTYTETDDAVKSGLGKYEAGLG